MRVSGFLLVLLSGCLGCGLSQTQTIRKVNIAEVLAAQTVVVRSGPAVCAGVYIKPQIVATAAHCLKDVSPTVTDVVTEGTIKAVPLIINIIDDVALLATEKDTGRTGLQPRFRPEWGEDVFAMGHPAGRYYTFHRGYVAFPMRNGNSIQLNMAAYRGFSGGPVTDRHGRLLGIVSTTIVGGGATDIVPSALIRRALEKVNELGSVTTSR